MKFLSGFVCGVLAAVVCLLVGILLLEQEIEIPVSLVPGPVLTAARAEFPDFQPVEADLVLRGFKRLAYEVEGRHQDQVYELLIASDGEVLSIELED